MCGFLTWFMYNLYFLNSFHNLYNTFEMSISNPVASKSAEQISKLALTPYELMKFIYIAFGRLYNTYYFYRNSIDLYN